MITKISELCFRDKKIPIYLDEYSNIDSIIVSWCMRNPETEYTGLMYIDYTGKCTYPENAVIPLQTDLDREMLPKSLIVGSEDYYIKYKDMILKRLIMEHRNRNKTRIDVLDKLLRECKLKRILENN